MIGIGIKTNKYHLVEYLYTLALDVPKIKAKMIVAINNIMYGYSVTIKFIIEKF